jgi:DNA-binding MarR family transcriptional regulator/GNAT superfamily N-acetyltransferase
MPVPKPSTIAAVRRFSRFYTRAIGVLHEGLLGSPLTLTEGRIVYEIANRTTTTASDLRDDLGLDAGYLSRTLKALEARSVITRALSPADARQSLLALTPEGQRLYRAINAASKREVGAMLQPLPVAGQARLVQAMAEIERLLGRPAPDASVTPAIAPAASRIILRPHRPGDIGWVIHRHGALYAADYGWDITFEALVAKVAGEFIETFDPATCCCFIAERAGEILGSAFVVPKDKATAKLRLVYVEASARGLGLGRQLVEASMQFARDAGYTRMTLWTNDVLVPARRLYETLGFEMTASEPHHSFGQDLIGETWERAL